MKHSHSPALLVAFFLVFGSAGWVRGQEVVRISEFLAVNDTGADDEDRDESDWIEIHNAGTTTVGLEGWYLTDAANNPTKWRFPAVVLEPDGYLIVFASGKDRRDPAGELHANFRLSGAGEYLGLVRPDGVTVVSEFAPLYPVQAADVSYGLVEATSQEVLIAPGAAALAWVPLDDALELQCVCDEPRPWTLEDFDDSAWLSGTTGVGYGYPGQVGLDVSAMRALNETVYIRIPFVVADPSVFRTLTLRMRADDGMIAYLNGQEIARSNAPEPGAETWNSGASASAPVARVVPAVDFPVRRAGLLHVGTNVLAIQGLNHGRGNASLLIVPELLATIPGTEQFARYFPVPTPGGPNNDGVETMGPVIAEVGHRPQMPTLRDDLQIIARITPTFAPLAEVQLHYRVMFEAPVVVPLLDDGRSGDGQRRGDAADHDDYVLRHPFPERLQARVHPGPDQAFCPEHGQPASAGLDQPGQGGVFRDLRLHGRMAAQGFVH
jgi:hypothetical protein